MDASSVVLIESTGFDDPVPGHPVLAVATGWCYT
jgi:hypothetical protein